MYIYTYMNACICTYIHIFIYMYASTHMPCMCMNVCNTYLPIHADHVSVHILLSLQVCRAAVGKINDGHVRVFGLDECNCFVSIRFGKDVKVVGS